MSAEEVPPSLSEEEADRLASKITPSWEAPPMDEEGETTLDVAPAAHPTPIVPAMHAETEPKLVAAEIRRQAGADIPDPNAPKAPAAAGVSGTAPKMGAASESSANGKALEEAPADATVRMPSFHDGLSDGDIMAADPVQIPGPPKTPGMPPPRKAPAATGNIIPYVPENERAQARFDADDPPISALRRSNRGLVIAVVGLVSAVAFLGVFFALRSSGDGVATASTSAAQVQTAPTSKADVPPPDTLADLPKTPALDPKKTEPKATAAASSPASPTPPTKPQPVAQAVPPGPSPTPQKAPTPGAGAGAGSKPSTPPPGKPGGIVRDNPF